MFIAKPKKPNSAKWKVAKSNGETAVQAYIQGEGHDVQEYSVVFVRGGWAQDFPGVNCVFRFVVVGIGSGVDRNSRDKLIRGALDFGGVGSRATTRSRYCGSSPYFTASVVQWIK